MTKTYACTVAYRSVDPEHMLSVLRLMKHVDVYELKYGDALVERARAIVATRFLLDFPECDVMVQMDADIAFAAEDVMTLAEQSREHDVVCGLYVTRSRDKPHPAAFLDMNVPADTTEPGPIPIHWPATGFMAVHRRVLERLAQGLPLCHPRDTWRFYPFFTPFVVQNDQGDDILLSEDYAFGELARRAGFGIYANPAIRLRHVGTYAYRLEDMAQTPLPQQRMRVTRTAETGYVVETAGVS